MSVRAYRVIQIMLADASFNLTYDQKLMNFLDVEAMFSYSLNEAGGMVDVPVKVLQKALTTASKLELSNDTVRRLKEDIAAAQANKDDSVTYSCF
jgi:hypothetical protein